MDMSPSPATTPISASTGPVSGAKNPLIGYLDGIAVGDQGEALEHGQVAQRVGRVAVSDHEGPPGEHVAAGGGGHIGAGPGPLPKGLDHAGDVGIGAIARPVPGGCRISVAGVGRRERVGVDRRIIPGRPPEFHRVEGSYAVNAASAGQAGMCRRGRCRRTREVLHRRGRAGIRELAALPEQACEKHA